MEKKFILTPRDRDYLSKEAEHIKIYEKGYRYDFCFGEFQYDMRKVIEHETFELQNTDILETCKKLYELEIDDSGENKKKTQLAINRIVEHFQDIYEEEELYVLWVTTEDNLDLYSCDQEEPDIYIIPDTSKILSDLGPDGVLFVSPVMFQKYEEE